MHFENEIRHSLIWFPKRSINLRCLGVLVATTSNEIHAFAHLDQWVQCLPWKNSTDNDIHRLLISPTYEITWETRYLRHRLSSASGTSAGMPAAEPFWRSTTYVVVSFNTSSHFLFLVHIVIGILHVGDGGSHNGDVVVGVLSRYITLFQWPFRWQQSVEKA